MKDKRFVQEKVKFRDLKDKTSWCLYSESASVVRLMCLMEQLLLFESVKLSTQAHGDATYFLHFYSDCVLVSEDLHSIHCLKSSCIQTED